MTDYITPLLTDGLPVVVTVVALGWARSILKRDIKGQQIAGIFQQLGIKKFEPSALNSKNLDEVGFQRLLTVLQTVSGPKSGGGLADLVQMMQVMNAAKAPIQAGAGSTVPNQ